MAAISIQKTFRCFRIKWRYEVYVSQFVDGSEMNDDGEAIPKSPLNGYFMYSAFILPKIKEENPNATLTEMVSVYSRLSYSYVYILVCFNSDVSIQLSTHIYSSLDDTHISSLQSTG